MCGSILFRNLIRAGEGTAKAICGITELVTVFCVMLGSVFAFWTFRGEVRSFKYNGSATSSFFSSDTVARVSAVSFAGGAEAPKNEPR